MNTNDDDLLAALRRAEHPADRRLAELLASAPGKEGCASHGKEGRTPRASDALAAFLAAAVSGVSPLTDTDDQPVPAHDTYQLEPVRLAQPPTRSSQMKPVTAFSRALKLSLLAKVVLGATLAIGSVGAVASTTPLGHGGDDVVIASPSTEATDDSAEAPEVEVDDSHERSQISLVEDRADAAEAAASQARLEAKQAAKAAKAAAKKAAAEKRAAAAAAAGTENDSDDAAENDSQDGDQNEADDAAENDSDDGDSGSDDSGSDDSGSDDSGSDDSGSDDSGSDDSGSDD